MSEEEIPTTGHLGFTLAENPLNPDEPDVILVYVEFEARREISLCVPFAVAYDLALSLSRTLQQHQLRAEIQRSRTPWWGRGDRRDRRRPGGP